MELLKSIIIDFCLFSLIEGYIFCFYFKTVCNCYKIKLYDGLLLGVINSVVSIIIPPILYQFVCFTIMGYFIYLKSEIKLLKSIKYSFLCLLFMSVIEMFYTMILELGFSIDMYNINNEKRFKFFIILKIIEIILLFLYKNKIKKGEIKMKMFAGEVVK